MCVPQIERATKAKHLECKVYFLGEKLELHEIANGPSLQLHSGFFPTNRHGKKNSIFPGFAYHQRAIKTGGIFPMAKLEGELQNRLPAGFREGSY